MVANLSKNKFKVIEIQNKEISLSFFGQITEFNTQLQLLFERPGISVLYNDKYGHSFNSLDLYCLPLITFICVCI